MTEREKKIVEAAGQVFLRYGVKRSTMNDIAQEAGIARQTLYNAFSNKDEVLRALIRDYNDQALAAIRQAFEKDIDLSEKLEALFQHMVIAPYDLLHSSPHAEDLLEGMNAAARDEIAAKEAEYVVLIEDMLAPESGAFDARGLSTAHVAELIYCAAKGAKYHTTSRKQFKRMLDTLKATILDLTRAK